MTLKLNATMRGVLSSDIPAADGLPPELLEISTDGFREADGCVVLDALFRRGVNAGVDDFPDRTGFECFVNSIHIDDYVDARYLSTAFLFVDACLARWRKQGLSGTMRAIVSCDEFGANVKFHLAREAESWLAEDLEGYEDPILVVDSDDKPLGHPEGGLIGMSLK